jgi:hypothetical protein
MFPRSDRVSTWLGRASPQVFSFYAITAAFGTYFCMYAFRKPFTAATYEDSPEFGGVGFKTILIASQTAGYTISKFLGIKVVSEIDPRRRAIGIFVLIAIAELALLLFAITPAPWSGVWLFVNGLPLGMVFGLVLGFLEGRRLTEALTAGLCASFIVSSGWVKTVGVFLLEVSGVPEPWMPALVGLAFLPFLFGFVWMLQQVPPPTDVDVALRTVRIRMSGAERVSFFRRNAFGLTALVTVFMLLTVIRSLRDDFAVEIWGAISDSRESTIFARSETLVMLGVVAINGAAVFVRSNRLAFLGSLGLMAASFVGAISTILARRAGYLSPFGYMALIGLFTYIAYVAFHTTVFERLIAATRERGNLGFLMTVADAAGYLAYVGVLVLGESRRGAGFLELFESVAIALGVASGVIVVGTIIYYAVRLPRDEAQRSRHVSDEGS